MDGDRCSTSAHPGDPEPVRAGDDHTGRRARRFGPDGDGLGPGPSVGADTTRASSGSFADALASAQSTTATSGSVPTSSGSLNRAGVDLGPSGPATSSQLNMPITSENVKAITAWEQAEGTAASFNPLATTQGGFSGESQFNSVGVKNYATTYRMNGIDA